MIRNICLLSLFVFYELHCLSQSQGINNLWYQGYASWAGPPTGGINIDFYTGVPVINYVNRPMDLSRTHANISDANGNMLFYTNGYYIADATDSAMMNGLNISPSGVNTVAPYGLVVPQACLILPKPGSNHLYYMFHSTLDNAPTYNIAFYLYYSIIDMSLNNGLGAVTAKNVVMITDSLNAGKITACKHANGMDWWVVCHRFNSNRYYKFLLTGFGVSSPIVQQIGTIRSTWDIGQVSFSPDGSKFAYFNAYYTTTATLDVYDFNRCNGVFSNPEIITIPKSSSIGGGLAFSSNSQFLYICNIDSIYQFDVSSVNIAATKTTVAVWDSFYSPNPPFGTYFDLAQLATDGKIYIGTGNSTFRMHVVNYPDSAGIACDVQQHSIILPAFSVGGVPNHPNYFLGCDTTCTPCLVGLTPGPSPKERGVTANPNPNNGVFTLQFDVQSTARELLIYDVNGRMVYKDYIAPWSQFKRVDMRATSQPAGIYLCMLKWGERSVAVKVIIQDE